MEYYHGVCRCCLAKGSFKRLEREYQWLGDREIYIVMMQECFGLSVAGGDESERLICEVCITRLRDASNFKKQVIVSEKYFQMSVDDSSNQELMEFPKPMLSPGNVKKEELDDDYNSAADDTAFEYDVPVKVEDAKPEPCEKEPVRITVRVNSKKRQTRKKTKKNEASTSNTSVQPDKIGRRTKTVIDDRKTSISATKRNRLMKKNAIAVLESSTVCPFKWHRQNYLCFFCHRTFKDPELLKDHTKKEHQKASIKGAVTYLRRDELVKIDVTKIECKLCDDFIPDLTALKSHLKVVHSKVFVEGYRDGLVPYKLQNNRFQCAICNEEFQYFIKLNQHMNTHFGNYICEACGKSFLSQDRLRCHSLSHGGSFRCNECPEIFDSLTQKTNHATLVHKKDKSLKCFYCGDTFSNYAQRKKHHKAMHNVDMPEYKCPFCAKVFQIMSKMTVHVKEVHMREKNYSCNVCEQKFFSKNHVQKHMIKHYGERIHQCEVCKKSYARKQTLRDHMRIHNNDRRFVCAVCSQGFVQNNSLKLHMRVHHPDVNA